MIETVSPAAQVAANAQAALARLGDELAALQASAEEARAEMRELLAERSTAQARRDDLAATLATAKADVERARLAEEMSAGTGLESQAHEATERASALWDAAHQDMQAHEAAWRERGTFLAQRLDYLQRSLDESASMSQSQQGKLAELRSIYDAAHADHGKDAQRALEAEFTAIAENREAIRQMLAEIDAQDAALRAQIPARLNDWPALARETLAAHLDYQPGPWLRMLQAWQELATLAGDHSQSIDAPTWQAYIGESSLPLWNLQQYGPRARWEQIPEPRRDTPIRQYSRMLANLAETLARLEAGEREQQVNERMR